jgi:hypothetical protein
MPRRRGMSLATDFLWSIVKWLETSDEDVSQDQESVRAVVILVEAPQDAGSNELAQSSPGEEDVLAVVHVGLLIQELGPINQQTVD